MDLSLGKDKPAVAEPEAEAKKSPKAGMTKLEASYHDHFPMVFEKKETPPGLTKDAEWKALNKLRANPAFESISSTYEGYSVYGLAGLNSRAERKFIKALFEAVTTDPGEARIQKMRDFKELRAQMAAMYVQNMVERETPFADAEQKKEAFLGILEGTVSATVFNALKSEGLVPADASADDLYERRRETTGRGR